MDFIKGVYGKEMKTGCSEGHIQDILKDKENIITKLKSQLKLAEEKLHLLEEEDSPAVWK